MCTVLIIRNPQATKRKSGIQDWHMALFVLSLLVLNASILFLHILLEGTIAKFEVQEVSSKENPSAQQGVGHELLSNMSVLIFIKSLLILGFRRFNGIFHLPVLF